MKTKNKPRKKLTDEEIDKIVVGQADNDLAWEKPIRRKAEPTSVLIPSELASRAAFLARLHRKASVGEWLKHIIQERIELEEAAFSGLKQELSSKGSPNRHLQ